MQLTATDTRIATVTYSGGGNFAVWSVDSQGQNIDLLVNEIGSYSGVVPLNFTTNGPAAALKITASGPWTVESAEASTAPRWDGVSPYAATGDSVVIVADVAKGLTPVTFTNNGPGNFAVIAYGTSRNLLVNEIGAYSGQTLMPSGTVVVTVQSDGDWTMAKS